MATMNISLPDPMKRWAETQTATGQYSNVSDYVRDLIRRDQMTKDKIAYMQMLVDGGRASGIGTKSLADMVREEETLDVVLKARVEAALADPTASIPQDEVFSALKQHHIWRTKA